MLCRCFSFQFMCCDEQICVFFFLSRLLWKLYFVLFSPVCHLSEGHFRYGYIDFRKPNLYQTNNKTFFFALAFVGFAKLMMKAKAIGSVWRCLTLFLLWTFYLKTVKLVHFNDEELICNYSVPLLVTRSFSRNLNNAPQATTLQLSLHNFQTLVILFDFMSLILHCSTSLNPHSVFCHFVSLC